MKRIFAVLLSALLIVGMIGPITVFAGDPVFARLIDPVSKWNYTYYYSGTIKLMVYTGNSENVVVPDKIGGLTVDGFEPGYRYMAENLCGNIRRLLIASCRTAKENRST